MRKIKKIFFASAVAVSLVACSSHEEKVKEEHSEGKEMVEEKAAKVEGIGEGLKTSGKDAISALTEGIGSVVKGAEEGFDKGLTKINLKADTSVSVYGMKIGKSGKYFSDSLQTNVVSVYTIFEENVDHDVVMVATDADKAEVGRSTVKEFKLSVKIKKKK